MRQTRVVVPEKDILTGNCPPTLRMQASFLSTENGQLREVIAEGKCIFIG